jgi:hypothetical protein|tara:strand:+ start:355 stop:1086 length:732 start_codon:yes stop_codon:yes gene_type:complete
MALPTSGPLSISQIENEFGGSGAKSLSEYYGAASGVPVSPNPLSISDFRGKSNVVTFTYELIGGGGGGGFGLESGGNYVTRGTSGGGSSIFIPSVISIASSSGGLGGRAGMYVPGVNEHLRAGQSTHYGNGGTAGPHLQGAAGRGGDAPSTSYGAGGGGGGGDARNNRYDNTGAGGEGGEAATRVTGSYTVVSGTTINITIGGGGAGHPAGNPGGNGAGGFAKITANGTATPFTSSGSITITS